VKLLSALIAALAVLTGCAFDATGGGPKPTNSTHAPRPAATVDDAARAACRQLTDAARLRKQAKHETPAPGWGATTSEMEAMTATINAHRFAMKSQVTAVRRWGLDTQAPEARMRAWCAHRALK
jgi:hypothetical protein